MSDSSRNVTRMEIYDLYKLAQDHNHEIASFPIKYAPAFSVEDSIGRCHIAMSDELSGPARMVQLAHELGHCEYAGFYTYLSPYEIRSRKEHRADRWAILKLLPLNEIRDAIRENDNLWDLADRFNVTPEFMQKALKFYLDQLGEQLCQEKRNST